MAIPPFFRTDVILHPELAHTATMDQVKLGILSAASIVPTMLKALSAVPLCACTATASRDVSKARRLATEYGIDTACTYKELLEQPVDAIYIPLPTGLATDWAVRSALAGFHVLVDKPFSSAEDVRRIIEACASTGVYFLDGTHFVHTARTTRVKQLIREGAIGRVKRLISSFSCPITMTGNIRSNLELEPMGAMGDLGWYVMRAAVTYLGVGKCSEIRSDLCEGKAHAEFPGVLECADGVIVFGTESRDSVSLNFSVDLACTFSQNVVILGTKGKLEIPEFMGPFPQVFALDHLRKAEDYSTDTEIISVKTVASYNDIGDPTLCYPVKNVEAVKEPGNLSQPSLLMREFCRIIQEQDDEAVKRWASEAISTQTLLDAAFKVIKRNDRI